MVALHKKIEKVQSKATKLLLCTKNLTYTDRLRFLILPTIYYRRLRGNMIMVFKIVRPTGNIDRTVACTFINSHSVTIGSKALVGGQGVFATLKLMIYLLFKCNLLMKFYSNLLLYAFDYYLK